MKTSGKKDGFKYQIEQRLILQNWVIVEISSNEYWWDDEHWKIEYQYDPKLSFYICFIVDPQYEGPRKKGQGIYQILATTKFPEDWNDRACKISSIEMSKRKFNVKLEQFMFDLINFKKGKLTTNR